MKTCILSFAVLLSQLVHASPIRNDGLTARDMFENPSVTVKNGTINGRYLAGFEQDLFLSMPYAQPPVGNLVSSSLPLL